MDSTEREYKTKEEMYDDCQQTVRSLPGILNARFSFDKSGDVSEIHILSDMVRNPKQIMRDIQSALYARYNLVLDRRIVSIAQLQTGAVRGKIPIRLACSRVELSVTKDVSSATVVLEESDEEYIGKAVSGNTAYGKRKMIAEATTKAVSEYLHDSASFTVVDVREMTVGDSEIELVLVSLNFSGCCEILVGAAVNEQDENFSVARATLDAVNRRIQLITNA